MTEKFVNVAQNDPTLSKLRRCEFLKKGIVGLDGRREILKGIARYFGVGAKIGEMIVDKTDEMSVVVECPRSQNAGRRRSSGCRRFVVGDKRAKRADASE